MNEKIINTIKNVAKQNKINIDFNDLNKDFKTYGIDSLKLMNLVFKIEQELNVRIDDNKLIEIKNLNDLIIELERIVK